MSANIDNLIEINLRKISESNDFSILRTTFVDENGSDLSDSESERVAKYMEIKTLINLHPSGYKCDITLFGQEVSANGGWLNHLSICAEEKIKIDQKGQLDTEVLKLQKENFEHLKTIRDQELRIRNLEEQTKVIELLKLYWWVLLTCIVIGIILKELWGTIIMW